MLGGWGLGNLLGRVDEGALRVVDMETDGVVEAESRQLRRYLSMSPAHHPSTTHVCTPQHTYVYTVTAPYRYLWR